MSIEMSIINLVLYTVTLVFVGVFVWWFRTLIQRHRLILAAAIESCRQIDVVREYLKDVKSVEDFVKKNKKKKIKIPNLIALNTSKTRELLDDPVISKRLYKRAYPLPKQEFIFTFSSDNKMLQTLQKLIIDYKASTNVSDEDRNRIFAYVELIRFSLDNYSMAFKRLESRLKYSNKRDRMYRRGWWWRRRLRINYEN